MNISKSLKRAADDTDIARRRFANAIQNTAQAINENSGIDYSNALLTSCLQYVTIAMENRTLFGLAIIEERPEWEEKDLKVLEKLECTTKRNKKAMAMLKKAAPQFSLHPQMDDLFWQ